MLKIKRGLLMFDETFNNKKYRQTCENCGCKLILRLLVWVCPNCDYNEFTGKWGYDENEKREHHFKHK